MTFEQRKRNRNLKAGYLETKGLKGGYCNRSACQAPLSGEWSLGPQWSMRDHETFTDERLYYCDRCARMFNGDDAKMGLEPRCTEVVEEPA